MSTRYSVAISKHAERQRVPDDVDELKHHRQDGKGFVNPWDSYRELQPLRILKALLWSRITGKSVAPDTRPPTVPVVKPLFLASRATKELRATWLGHACYLVEFPSGLRVLFDPVFSQRCSPFSWLGPKRFTEMPCDIADIPFVDVVIISHNHYDHLDYPTIMKLRKHHPDVHFFVPKGNKIWFTESGLHGATELDWWEERDLLLESGKHADVSVKPNDEPQNIEPPNIAAKISCLPCQHTSNRGLFDRSKTLWASWSVESGGKKVWFGGDTGYRAVPPLPKEVDDYGSEFDNLPYCPAFKQIGNLRGPFDLGLIPIGAYDPRWVMSPMHANPFDSVNIFIDTKCKRALGMHWGTWVLTEEPVLEPPELLKTALGRKGIPTSAFETLDIGQSQEITEAKSSSAQ
jgi:L-ascorbate metabolism protein UlaG (beta-lactamase superfamily)